MSGGGAGPSNKTFTPVKDYVSSPMVQPRFHPDLHSTKCEEAAEDFARMQDLLKTDPDSLERVHFQLVPCSPGPAMIASVTALQHAVEKLHCECVRFLLNAGAQVERPDYARRPLLMLAMQVWNHKKSLEIIHLLFSKGISSNYLYDKFLNGITTFLNFAISINFIDMIEILLKNGAVTEDISILQSEESNNYVTPLYQAFQKEKPETCKILFLHGAMMNPHKLKPNVDESNISESILHLFVDRMYFLPASSRELHLMGEMLALYSQFGGNMRLRKNGKTALEHMTTSFAPHEDWYGFDETLEQLTCNPLSLQELSRLAIRDAMGQGCWGNLSSLPLPRELHAFMRFQ